MLKYIIMFGLVWYFVNSPVQAATADRRDFCEETAESDVDFDKCEKEQKAAGKFLKKRFKELQLSLAELGNKHPAYTNYFSCKKDNTDSENLLDKAGWKRCVTTADNKKTVANSK